MKNPLRRRPQGVIGKMFRLPVPLYRHGFGFLFGKRFLLVAHTGRKSGRLRHNVVEVMGYDASTDEYVVMSGWGPQANWYRNLCASPATEIRIGRRRFQPEQRSLTTAEAADVLAIYEKEHPWLLRGLSSALGWQHEPTVEARTRIVADRPMVGFRPLDADRTPPISTDDESFANRKESTT
jgi:deazaflavin-dependent oxidoreductase (nitroreductase family)